MQPMTAEWGKCANGCLDWHPSCLCYRQWRRLAVEKTDVFFFFFFFFKFNFPIMWLIFTQYRPWPASRPPAAATEHSQPLTPSQGPLPTDKSYTYSFGRGRYSWHSGQQQKYRFWQQTKQPSVNTKGCLQFYYSIRTLWQHDILPASAASSFDINNICKSTLTTIWIFNNPITTQ